MTGPAPGPSQEPAEPAGPPGAPEPPVGDGDPRPRQVRRRTMRGLVVMGGSTAGQALLQIVFLTVLARAIAPAQFGLVAGALVAVNLTTVLAESGVGVAVVQRATLTRDHLRVAWTLSVLLGLGFWAVLAAAAPAIEDLLRLPGLTPILRVVSLVFVINGLSLSSFLLSRRMEFGKLAIAELTSYAVGYGAVAVTLAFLGYGPWAIVWGQLAQSAMRVGIVTALAPHVMRPSLARTPLRELLTFGGGYTVGRLALWAATQVDNLVVARFLGPAALGLYGRAYQLVQMPANLFGQVANEVLFPGMAAKQDDQAALRRVFGLGVAFLAVLALPTSLLAAITSESLVLVVLGPDWLPLRAAFNVIIFGLLFRTSSKLTDALMKARGAVYRRAWRAMVFASMTFTGAIIGQRDGLRGVAIGVLVALAANYLLTNYLCLTLVSMGWRDFVLAHRPALVLAVVAGVVGLGVQQLVDAATDSAVAELVVVWGAAGLTMLLTVRVAWRGRGLGGLATLVVDVESLLSGRARRTARTLLGPGYAPLLATRGAGGRRRGAADVGVDPTTGAVPGSPDPLAAAEPTTGRDAPQTSTPSTGGPA